MITPQNTSCGRFARLLLGLSAALLSTLNLSAILVPADRTAPWEDAGVPGGIPVYSVGVDVTNYGAVGDGVTDDTAAIQAAIDACPAGFVVYIPDGSYYLTDTLNLPSEVSLRGESRMGTILKMDHSDHGIYGGTYSNSSAEFDIVDGLDRGSFVITLSSIDSSKFVPGRLLEIKQDNDPNIYQIGYKGYEPWTDRQTAMTNEVVSVSGNEVTMKHPIFMEFSTSLNPKVRAQSSIYRAGVENLTIDRVLDDSQGTGINVFFFSAKQCWVKDIWSEKTYAHHIRMARSLQCEIRGNVINDTWLDSGGQGYGIVAQDRSTLNLIEDNSCNHLRHAYVVQSGASGNVFGYNFSSDPHSDDCNHCVFPDLSAHGSVANYTLWEGNKAVQFYLDNVHGSNPWNTAFRNYLTKPNSGYPGIDVAETSKWATIIGNVVGNEASAGEAIDIHSAVAATTILTGNLNGKSGVTEWDPAYDTTLPDSLYLAAKPAFVGSKPWPLHGPGIGVAERLPAEDRWYALSGLTPAVEPAVATTPVGFLEALFTPVVYYDCEDQNPGVLTDLSENLLDGVIDGATYVSGSHDGSVALHFNGSSDEVVIDDQPVLSLGDAFTLSAWVRTEDASKNQCILGKNNEYYIYLYGSGSDARVRVGLRIGGSWILYSTSPSNTITEDVWAHIAVTYDGSELRVYLDGALAGTSTISGSLNSGNNDLEIGTLWNGYRFLGDIDAIAIFDETLAESDVGLLYSGEWLSPVLPASVASYEFEEGAGATALDSGPNQLDGSIVGASYALDSARGAYALSFDGIDDEVVVADSSWLDCGSALSLAAWVKPFDDASNQCVIGRNTAYYLYLYPGTYGLRVRCGLRIGGSWVLYTTPNNGASSIQENVWSHVALTYEGTLLRVYIDGVEVGSSAISGAVDNANKDLELGTIWGGFRFEGLMDDVHVFDVCLFPDEVQALAE